MVYVPAYLSPKEFQFCLGRFRILKQLKSLIIKIINNEVRDGIKVNMFKRLIPYDISIGIIERKKV